MRVVAITITLIFVSLILITHAECIIIASVSFTSIGFIGPVMFLGVNTMPNIHQNLVGKTFGHLTVLAKSKERGKNGAYKWVCRCDCGNTIVTTTASLNSGTPRSCGHISRKNVEKFKDNPQLIQERHLTQLNNRPPITSSTGYRNISTTTRNGKLCYRVSVVYDYKQHTKLVNTLEEALVAREELRKQWWPNYKKQSQD